MTIKPIIKLASALVLFGAMGAANAASLSLTPDVAGPDPDGFVTLDIVMDFSDVNVLGGGFDVVFDSSDLSFVDWTPNLVGEADFQRAPDIGDGILAGIAFGSFSTGVSGIATIGTLTFELAAGVEAFGGTTMVGMQGTNTAAGPFVDFVTFQVVPVQYNGATVNTAIIPVPAAVWLMFGGLGALFGFGRKAA